MSSMSRASDRSYGRVVGSNPAKNSDFSVALSHLARQLIPYVLKAIGGLNLFLYLAGKRRRTSAISQGIFFHIRIDVGGRNIIKELQPIQNDGQQQRARFSDD